MPKTNKKKGSLLESLKSHQAKVDARGKQAAQQSSPYSKNQPSKKRKRPSHAAEDSDKNQATSSSSTAGPSATKRKPIIPFHEGRRILLVGEGNFSFALSLLSQSTTWSLIIATAFDSQDECYRKYPDAPDIVKTLRAAGVVVYFNVDATKLDQHKALKKLVIDTIVFNFPHVGAGIKDQDRNIAVNQRLLVDFFQAAAPLLAKGKDPSSVPGSRKKRKRDPDDEEADEDHFLDDDEQCPPPTRGTVLVTLRDAPPYTLWYTFSLVPQDLTRLAKNPPPTKPNAPPPAHKYKVVRSFQFHPDAYRGYEHRRTIGGATGLKANEDLQKGQGICRTWEFVLRDEDQDS
ncbi:hypothetical protein DL93DRAFT_2211241 [Clavulina sp. PMI_390]|nr:hypothetical protein DL93DRAFT_2211241 [Clavulina sp. PMI_390]